MTSQGSFCIRISVPSLLILFVLFQVAATTLATPFQSSGNPPYKTPQKPKEDLVTEYNLPFLDQVAQMSQMDINALLLPHQQRINVTAVKELVMDQNKVGSLFNSPSATDNHTYVPTVEEWREMMQAIYDISTGRDPNNKMKNEGEEGEKENGGVGGKIPILFGLDSVHGANYVFNATIFPQQIGCAATFNESHAFQMGWVTGLETRYAGVPWVFSPILGIAVQPSWARVYETFGEDPHLASKMGVHIIKGLQSPPPRDYYNPNASYEVNVAACMKHFAGYPNVRTGHDRTPVWLPINILLQYFIPSFQAGISEGEVLSVMENYIELNGRPVVASNLLLTFMLRDMLNFTGMLVTDYNEIYNLKSFHHAAGTDEQAVFMSLSETTIDMGMVGSLPPTYPHLSDIIAELFANDAERVKDSANRVLALKKKVGLLSGESPVPPKQSSMSGDAKDCVFACNSHRKAALDVSRESVTLLQNNNTLLPLFPELGNGGMAVIGQACDSVPLMAGGWTVHWQGTSNKSAYPWGKTILQSLREIYNSGSDAIVFEEGCNVTENSICGPEHFSNAVNQSMGRDYVVVCVGERHYAEKPGDIDDMTLPGEQIKLVNAIADVNDNVIVILVEGRPRVLQNIPHRAKAILHAYLPGPSGGEAVAEILLGKVNPSGKLPITYPKTVNNAPIQYFRKFSADTGGDYDVQWRFGHGLSYTTFSYKSFTYSLDFTNLGYLFNVTLMNTGKLPGKETVLLYGTQKYRYITPEVQLLRAFQKVELQPLETKSVILYVKLLDLSFYDEFNCQHVDGNTPGVFTVANLSLDLELIPYNPSCSIWGWLASQHDAWHVLPGPAPPPNQTPDYFISSIVCFGAGIVGTVILVQWLRLRNRRQKEKQEDEQRWLMSSSNAAANVDPGDHHHEGGQRGQDPYLIDSQSLGT